MLNIKLGKY